MARKGKNTLRGLMNQPIFRLYCAIIWRYLVWLFALKILGALIFICLDVITIRVVLADQAVFQVIAYLYEFYLAHMLAFYLALESVMNVGFKSRQYKLVIENTRRKSKSA